jgi:hypothetical protein
LKAKSQNLKATPVNFKKTESRLKEDTISSTLKKSGQKPP